MSPHTPDSFASDNWIPEISASDAQDSFSFDNPFEDVPPPFHSRTGFPWKIIILLGIGALIVLGLGISGFIANLVDPSDRVVQSYYEAMEAQNFNKMREFTDPDEPLTDNILPSLDAVKKQTESFLGQQLGMKDFDLKWKFQNLTYKVLEQTGESAKVQVRGKVRMYEANSQIGITLPYDWLHELSRKNGHWYLKTH